MKFTNCTAAFHVSLVPKNKKKKPWQIFSKHIWTVLMRGGNLSPATSEKLRRKDVGVWVWAKIGASWLFGPKASRVGESAGLWCFIKRLQAWISFLLKRFLVLPCLFSVTAYIKVWNDATLKSDGLRRLIHKSETQDRCWRTAETKRFQG